MKNVSPLLGFNNNIRYRGKMFHVQTEDSGIKHPHVITHLFTDGGRIIKTTKTSYAEHLDREDLSAHVKRLMMDQHKAMFVALKEGQFDSVIVALSGGPHVSEVASALKEGKETKEGSPAPRISAGLAAAAAAAAGRSSIPVATPVEPDEPPIPAASGPVSLPPPEAPAAPVAAQSEAKHASAPRLTPPVRPGMGVPPASPPVAPPIAPTSIPRPNRSTHLTPGGSARVSPPPVPVAPQATTPASAAPEVAAASAPPQPGSSAPGARLTPPPPPTADTTYRTVMPATEREKPRPASGRHAVSRPASIFASSKPSPQSSSIFGEERISDKSLDEVILTYLAEDLDTPPPKK
ncbi:MAG: hypothetical protein U0165_01525 [Polyangiaceae bacterium]